MKQEKDYKLMLLDDSAGFYLKREDLLSLIRICQNRHKYYYELLVEVFEHLENEKFKEDFLDFENIDKRKI